MHYEVCQNTEYISLTLRNDDWHRGRDSGGSTNNHTLNKVIQAVLCKVYVFSIHVFR